MRKNTIYKLDSISKYSIYSKLNNDIERMLGDRSLKAFVKINKEPKKAKKINYLEEVLKKFPKEQKKFEDPNEYINQIIKKNSENIKSNKYYKIFNTKKNENYHNRSIQHHFKKKKTEDIISIDPFKYNPNYDAVYKKIPYTLIIEPSQNNKSNISSFKENNSKSLRRQKISEILNTDNTIENNNLKDNSTIETNRHLVKNRLNKSSDINTLKLPIINTNRIGFGNNNHALRFSKYGNSRINQTENKNESEENIILKNSINKHNIKSSHDRNINNKKTNFPINFDKMMSRKENNLVYSSSLDNPSFNRYSPNYDFIRNSSAKISFDYHNLDNDQINKKKNLLRKLMHSYDADIHYTIINDEQLKPSNSSNILKFV